MSNAAPARSQRAFRFTVVITKSTVPVGTGDEVERLIREANPSADVEAPPSGISCARAPRSAISKFRTDRTHPDERARR